MSKNFSDKEGATKEEMWVFGALASLVILFQIGAAIKILIILFF
ncbi:hypothetical protein [Ammoniphilus sp. 3BR4]